MNKLIEVTEETSRLGDRIEYIYLSPTHWTELCRISIGSDNKPRLNWGSGGTNSGFSDILIANAMKQAFTLAQHRLCKLDSAVTQGDTL